MTASTPISETVAPSRFELERHSARERLTRSLVRSAPIFFILAVLLVVLGLVNPRGFEPAYYLLLLKRAAPLMVLAAGQVFVIIAGEFDLSVGAIITAVVVGASIYSGGDQGMTYPVIGGLLVFGVVVGLVNGFVTTRLRVPSFLATLGMLLVIQGAVQVLTTGAPRGSLPANFRAFGRSDIQAVPLLGNVPVSVIVLAIIGVALFLLLHRTNFGRQVFAVGGNARAAGLAGADVAAVRTAAFVISAVAGILAGILLGGFGGNTNAAGEGYEFQAISAVVLGGAVLGGGRGSVLTAMAGALTLEALFTVLNFVQLTPGESLPPELRYTVQGVIIIAAVAYASFRLRRSG